MLDLIIKNGKCYIDGELKDVDIAVKDKKIQADAVKWLKSAWKKAYQNKMP